MPEKARCSIMPGMHEFRPEHVHRLNTYGNLHHYSRSCGSSHIHANAPGGSTHSGAIDSSLHVWPLDPQAGLILTGQTQDNGCWAAMDQSGPSDQSGSLSGGHSYEAELPLGDDPNQIYGELGDCSLDPTQRQYTRSPCHLKT